MKVLMVCLGNICRSPLAHGILQQRVNDLGLNWEIDSAGTGDWHVGELPDSRAITEARKHGIDISDQRARHFSKNDFKIFDYILTMDTDNFNTVIKMANNAQEKDRVHMIMNFANPGKNIPVPDPYYDSRFSLVYEMLEEAIDKFIEHHTVLH